MAPQRSLFSRATLSDIRFLALPVRTLLPLTLGLLIAVQGLALVLPYLWKLTVDTIMLLQADPNSPALMYQLVWLIVGSAAMSMLINGIRRWKDHLVFDILLRLERDLPVMAQAKLMALSLGFHERQQTGKTIVRVERGTSRMVELMANGLFDVLPTFIQLLGTFALMAWLKWQVALLFLPAIPLFMILTRRVNLQAAPLRKQVYDLGERGGSQLAQSLMNIHTVQSFAQSPAELSRQRQTRSDIYATEMRQWKLILDSNLVRDTLINVGRTVVVVYSIMLLLRQEITLGSLVMFIALTENAYTSLFRMSRMFDRGSQWAEAIGRLAKLLREPLRVTESPNAVPLGPMRGEITFRNVSFSYTGAAAALQDITCTIPAGSTAALVGLSGGGKSTFVRLLFRHYDPLTGTVLIDGRPLTELTLASFRSQMAIVPQEVEIFDGSIRDNIVYAKPEATEEEIRTAAAVANADEFIAKLANGYDTLVGERGVKLSGGQRQRLGIARALIVNPRILVFDEATSHLDSHSERLIQAALRNIQGQRTVLIVAHRLSTIRQADQIFVIDKGGIIEHGRHDELLARSNGAYAHFHQLQMDAGVLTPSG